MFFLFYFTNFCDFVHTPGGSIFALNRLIIPVNVPGTHWFVICVYFREHKIKAYDSLPPEEGGRMEYLELIHAYIADEYAACNKGAKMPAWELIPCLPGNKDAPRQDKDLHNCAIYTCLFMECLINHIDPWILSHTDIQSNIERNGRQALLQALNKSKPIFHSTYNRNKVKNKGDVSIQTKSNNCNAEVSSTISCNSASKVEYSMQRKSLTPYIEELAFHLHSGKSTTKLAKLKPMPKPWKFNFTPPNNHDSRWTYDVNRRIVNANFSWVSNIGMEDKAYLGQLMERDDITVICEGLLPKLNGVSNLLDELLQRMWDRPYPKFRQFNRVQNGDWVTYQERMDRHVIMRVDDYVRYLNIVMGEDPSSKSFTFEEDGKEIHFEKATDVVFYLLDLSLSREFGSLFTQLNAHFKMPEILPGGDWCMQRYVSFGGTVFPSVSHQCLEI